VELDGTAVFLDDAAGGWEAQARAAGLGGVVRPEDLCGRVGRYSRSGVSDSDVKFRRWRRRAARGAGRRRRVDTDEDLALRGGCGVGGYGFDGVEKKIKERLLESGRIDSCDGRGAGRGEANVYGRVLSLGREEVEKFLDEVVDVCGRGGEAQASGKLEEIGENAAEALGFAAEGVEAAEEPTFFIGRKLSVGDVLGEELGVEADGGERILDFVGQPTGHGAKFREALRIACAALGVVALLGVPAMERGSGAPNSEGGEGGACAERDEEGRGVPLRHGVPAEGERIRGSEEQGARGMVIGGGDTTGKADPGCADRMGGTGRRRNCAVLGSAYLKLGGTAALVCSQAVVTLDLTGE